MSKKDENLTEVLAILLKVLTVMDNVIEEAVEDLESVTVDKKRKDISGMLESAKDLRAEILELRGEK